MDTGLSITLSGSLIQNPTSLSALLLDAAADTNTCMTAGAGGGSTCSAGSSTGGNPTFAMGLDGRGASGAFGGFGGGGSGIYYDSSGLGGVGGNYSFDIERQYREYAPLQWFGSEPPLCVPPGGAVNCVTADTRVSLYPDGCALACELKAGDVVLSKDDQGNPCGERVSEVSRSQQPCLRLTTTCGRSLRCTLSHPVMVPDADDPRGKQMPAEGLSVGDHVLLQDGAAVEIANIESIGEHPVFMISLEGPNHVYLAGGIWSHNKLVPAWPAPGP